MDKLETLLAGQGFPLPRPRPVMVVSPEQSLFYLAPTSGQNLMWLIPRFRQSYPRVGHGPQSVAHVQCSETTQPNGTRGSVVYHWHHGTTGTNNGTADFP